jgi:hypothetical protein
MFIVWIAVGVAIGWLIPQPTLTYKRTGERVGLLRWLWLSARFQVGAE